VLPTDPLFRGDESASTHLAHTQVNLRTTLSESTMSKKTPAQIVKEKFGEKAKLVEAVQQFVGNELWVNKLNESKGLAHVSNAKLLRLLEVFTTVKGKFGSRQKLVDAILEAEKRTKDTAYASRYAEWPVARLFDHLNSVTKRNAAAAKKGTSSKKAAPAKAAPAKAEKKPAAKKPAAKKSAK